MFGQQWWWRATATSHVFASPSEGVVTTGPMWSRLTVMCADLALVVNGMNTCERWTCSWQFLNVSRGNVGS